MSEDSEFRVAYKDMVRLFDAINDLTHYESTTAKHKKKLIEDVYHAVDNINHPINVVEFDGAGQVPDNVVDIRKRKLDKPSTDLFFD